MQHSSDTVSMHSTGYFVARETRLCSTPPKASLTAGTSPLLAISGSLHQQDTHCEQTLSTGFMTTGNMHHTTPQLHTPILQLHTPTPQLHTPTLQLHTPTLQLYAPTLQLHTPTLQLHTCHPILPNAFLQDLADGEHKMSESQSSWPCVQEAHHVTQCLLARRTSLPPPPSCSKKIFNLHLQRSEEHQHGYTHHTKHTKQARALFNT